MSKSNLSVGAATEIPLDAATADVIARYKRGNDMLASAAVALRRLRERIEAGEAGPEWDWPRYRTVHLEPYIQRRWIERQLKLAPPGASTLEVTENVEKYHDSERKRLRDHRAGKSGVRTPLSRTAEYSQESEYEEPTRQIEESPQGDAVSDTGGGGEVDHFLTTAPHDDSEGGDSVVTESVHESIPAAPWPASAIPGKVAYYIDPKDPASVVANALSMLLSASREISPHDASVNYPENMPLYSNDADEIAQYMSEFAEEFRARYGNGNDAALAAE